MLRKRSSSNQKALLNMGSRIKPDSFLFVAFDSKTKTTHSDQSHHYSLRSPTSPLDFTPLPNFTNPFRLSSSNEVQYYNTWDSNKVGLSIIHSLHNDDDDAKALQSRRIITRDSVYFDSSKTLPQTPNVVQFSEIELSEDYTCVRRYGPNPKVTHIFNDCILECHVNNPTNFEFSKSQTLLFPPNDFLSICYTCKRKLEGEDIYIYRGEKAFCSCECRSEEILIEEALEKNGNTSPPENSDKLGDILEMTTSKPTMFIATACLRTGSCALLDATAVHFVEAGGHLSNSFMGLWLWILEINFVILLCSYHDISQPILNMAGDRMQALGNDIVSLDDLLMMV